MEFMPTVALSFVQELTSKPNDPLSAAKALFSTCNGDMDEDRIVEKGCQASNSRFIFNSANAGEVALLCDTLHTTYPGHFKDTDDDGDDHDKTITETDNLLLVLAELEILDLQVSGMVAGIVQLPPSDVLRSLSETDPAVLFGNQVASSTLEYKFSGSCCVRELLTAKLYTTSSKHGPAYSMPTQSRRNLDDFQPSTELCKESLLPPRPSSPVWLGEELGLVPGEDGWNGYIDEPMPRPLENWVMHWEPSESEHECNVTEQQLNDVSFSFEGKESQITSDKDCSRLRNIKARTTQPLPRDPLPARERNAHPGQPDKPKVYRTPKQMQKMRDEAAILDAQIEAMQIEKLRLSKELDTRYGEASTARVSSIQTLSDLKNYYNISDNMQEGAAEDLVDDVEEKDAEAQQQDPSDEEQEFFDVYDDRDGEDLSMDLDVWLPEEPTPRIVVKKKAELKEIPSLKGMVKERPSHLAGINQQWLTATLTSRSKKKTAMKNIPISGLDDDDVKDTARNYVDVGDTDSEDNHDTAQATPRLAKPAVTSRKYTKTPSVAPVKSSSSAVTRKPIIIKTNPSLIANYSLGDDIDESVEHPKFLVKVWESQFLPTMYHLFFSSEDVFAILTKGSDELLEFITKVLDVVVPGHSYTVREGTKLYATVYDYLGEKVSKLGSRGIEVVDTFLKQPDYHNNPEATRGYIKWALRGDGPSIYGRPTPEECEVKSKKKEDGYIAPKEVFESRFVVDTTSPFLKLMKGSVWDFGWSYGGVALAVVSVERGFRVAKLRLKDPKAKPPVFGRHQVGPALNGVLEIARKLSVQRREKLLDLFGLTTDIAQDSLKKCALVEDDSDDEDMYTRMVHFPSQKSPERQFAEKLMLLSLGYRLRPRYDPDWIPSWSKDMGKMAFIRMLLHEDALHLYCALHLVNDSARLSDGQKVVLKLVDYASTETTISRYFSEEPQRSDPRNHCVPILDVISLPNHPSKALLVMPLLYAFDRLPFRRVGEFAEAMQQFIENCPQVRSRSVHQIFELTTPRAACRPNLVMDASKVIPKGFHFQRPNTHDGVTRKFDWLERWSVKPNKYYFTNFASSAVYPEEQSTETRINPQAEAEVVNLLRCDPFKQDVKQLGATLLRVVQEHHGLEPFLPILELMTLPTQRLVPRLTSC
ncbi:hypothetical protein D9615_006622 [Tricholomella constricta]|uniref:Uncharacterized protein n=1 Tax=Tricholomella constricta TaxID=117010 RepID=A0A8H5HA03_9AGAR|nr:hypothetical protein D9615_006622 [Tricholomella constricta]